MTTNGDILLVASQFAQTLDFFDASTLTKLATLSRVTAQPHEIAWDPGRRLAYMAHTYRLGGYGENHPKAHEISVIDPARREIIDIIDISPYLAPHDVEYDPNQDLIVTGIEADGAGNGLVLIDGSTRRLVGSIPLQAPNAHWLSLTPDGAKAYVTHKEAEAISVVDLVARRQTGVIAAPGGAEEIDCSPAGRFVYAGTPVMSIKVDVSKGRLTKVPNPDAPPPCVVKVDTRTDQVVGRVEFQDYLAALRVAPDGRVVVSEFHFPGPDDPPGTAAPGVVNVIDADQMRVAATIQCDELPFTIRCSADGSTAFVANVKTGTVTVIDLDNYRTRATLDNNFGAPFGGTHGMCYVPAASQLSQEIEE